MPKKIAVIDDEPDICELVSINLKKEGYQVDTFNSGEKFFKYLEKNIPDLIVLDIMLPDVDGYEICKKVKSDSKTGNIPIIMLSAKGEELDKVLGLELGADDYVAKPFSPRELAARVKAILRRESRQDKESANVIHIGSDIKIDKERYEVYVQDKKIDTTTTEFKIMALLAERPGIVFSRDKILDHLWGYEKIVIDRTVDVHIKHLREKLGAAGNIIRNVRGIGYKCEA